MNVKHIYSATHTTRKEAKREIMQESEEKKFHVRDFPLMVQSYVLVLPVL